MDVFTVYTTPKKHCAKWKKFSHQRPYNSLALYHDPFYIFAQFSPASIGFGTGGLEPNFLLQRLFKKLLIHFNFLSNIHYSASCYWRKCQICTIPVEMEDPFKRMSQNFFSFLSQIKQRGYVIAIRQALSFSPLYWCVQHCPS